MKIFVQYLMELMSCFYLVNNNLLTYLNRLFYYYCYYCLLKKHSLLHLVNYYYYDLILFLCFSWKNQFAFYLEMNESFKDWFSFPAPSDMYLFKFWFWFWIWWNLVKWKKFLFPWIILSIKELIFFEYIIYCFGFLN